MSQKSANGAASRIFFLNCAVFDLFLRSVIIEPNMLFSPRLSPEPHKIVSLFQNKIFLLYFSLFIWVASVLF
jgi:hypothetical protein